MVWSWWDIDARCVEAQSYFATTILKLSMQQIRISERLDIHFLQNGRIHKVCYSWEREGWKFLVIGMHSSAPPGWTGSGSPQFVISCLNERITRIPPAVGIGFPRLQRAWPRVARFTLPRRRLQPAARGKSSTSAWRRSKMLAKKTPRILDLEERWWWMISSTLLSLCV
jgi:hypothetical protein